MKQESLMYVIATEIKISDSVHEENFGNFLSTSIRDDKLSKQNNPKSQIGQCMGGEKTTVYQCLALRMLENMKCLDSYLCRVL